MKSHSMIIAGRKTSVSLEDGFWKSLREIAKVRNQTSAQVVAAIKLNRQYGTLASAIRLFVLGFYLEHRAQNTLAPSRNCGARSRTIVVSENA
jgi:predicted DNA-binding ribbon-helix-helix protein